MYLHLAIIAHNIAHSWDLKSWRVTHWHNCQAYRVAITGHGALNLGASARVKVCQWALHPGYDQRLHTHVAQQSNSDCKFKSFSHKLDKVALCAVQTCLECTHVMAAEVHQACNFDAHQWPVRMRQVILSMLLPKQRKRLVSILPASCQVASIVCCISLAMPGQHSSNALQSLYTVVWIDSQHTL